MDDPIQRHPTRAEQLDILATLVADRATHGAACHALDLGCGTGYVAHLILRRGAPVNITGVDISSAALAEAADNLSAWAGRFQPVQGDLRLPESLALSRPHFDVVYSCLTFHDLGDDQKLALISWAMGRLAPGGLFLLYDRIRLTAPGLFPLQRSLWQRIEATTGVAMRTAVDFDAYQQDLGTDNAPAPLASYLAWFEQLNCDSACLHLHGNVALLAATPRG